jgi:hypothetical protein
MKPWMLPCKDVSEKLSTHMDTPLPFTDWLKVRMHLLLCKYCLRFYRQLQLVRKICKINEIPETDADISLSLQAKARMKTNLRRWANK